MLSWQSSLRLSSIAVVGLCLFVFQNCSPGLVLMNSQDFSSVLRSGIPVNPQTKFTCANPNERGVAQKNFRRLIKSEITVTVTSLFGSAIANTTKVSTAITAFPSETPGDLVHEMVNNHTYNQISGLYNLAEAISDEVFVSQATRDRVFGACATINEACVRTFLQNKGARILRRMPSQARQTELISAFTTMGGGQDGLKALLTIMLMSPEFAFHLEVGRDTAVVDSGRNQLSDFEVANRISYAITGGPPDDQLFAAAAANQLSSLVQVRGQVIRLVETAAARTQFETVLDSWLGTSTIQNPNEILAAKLGFSSQDFISESRRELMDYATYMVFDQNADLPSLLSAPLGFPRSDRMAKIYGSQTVGADNQPVALKEGHGGLLLRPSVLVKGSFASSPILRGVAVRKRLFCETLPSPDFSVVSTRTQELDTQDTTLLSNRDVATVITSSNSCAGCHRLINPIGFAMEKFDSLGMARQIETVFNPDGSIKTTHPINTVVTDPALENNGPTSLSGSQDLMESIAGSSKARSCASERLFTHSRLRSLDSLDGCVVSEVEQSLKAGASVKEAWILSIANEDIFWRKVSQ